MPHLADPVLEHGLVDLSLDVASLNPVKKERNSGSQARTSEPPTYGAMMHMCFCRIEMGSLRIANPTTHCERHRNIAASV